MEENTQISRFYLWLKERHLSGRQFARRSLISEHTVFKAMRGKPIRCDTVKKFLIHCKELLRADFKIVDHKGNEID